MIVPSGQKLAIPPVETQHNPTGHAWSFHGACSTKIRPPPLLLHRFQLALKSVLAELAPPAEARPLTRSPIPVRERLREGDAARYQTSLHPRAESGAADDRPGVASHPRQLRRRSIASAAKLRSKH